MRMNKQQAYDKGYQAGQHLYTERPNGDRLAVISWSSTDAVKEDIPMAKYGDYLSGYVAGYEAAKGSEVKR